MTYNAVAGDEDINLCRDYVKLEDARDDAILPCQEAQTSRWFSGWAWSWWWWAKLVVVVLFLAAVGAVFFKWVGPFLMDKVFPHLYNY